MLAKCDTNFLSLDNQVSDVAVMSAIHDSDTYSVASKYHAKVSRNFWHESLNLFGETFP